MSSGALSRDPSAHAVDLLAQPWLTGSRLLRHSSEIHRQQYTGLGQFPDGNNRARWPAIAHHLEIGSIHRLKVRHVLQEDIDMRDMTEVGAHRIKHHDKRFQDLPCLGADVRSRQLPRRRIEAGRAPDPYVLADLGDVTIRADRGRRVRRGERFHARFHLPAPAT
jgi:hypothetical protein